MTFLCHHRQRDFFLYLLVCNLSHDFHIYVDRNTTAVNKLQVAIKYTFDLEVRNVRGQIASNFFQGVHMFRSRYFYSSWKLLTFCLMIL